MLSVGLMAVFSLFNCFFMGQFGLPDTTDIMNSFSTLGVNWMNQKYADKSFERQKNASIEFWNMQNAYNTPEQQMQRFQAAGLNPNLVYGQGNNGNAQSIPTPDVQPANFRAPVMESGRADLMSLLLGQADLKIKNAQADNLSVQNQEIIERTHLLRMQGERAGFDLGFEKGLSDVSADYRREQVRSLRNQTDVLLHRNVREAAMNASNVNEAFERMLTLQEQRKAMPLDRARTFAETQRIRAEIGNLRRTGVLQKMDIELRKMGVNPQDPMWARYVGRFMQDIGDGKVTAASIGSSVWKWILGE